MNTMNTITKVLREYHYILHLATCRTMRSQLLISKHKCVFLCWVHHHSQKVKFGTRRHLLQPPGRPSWTLKSVPSKRPPTNWTNGLKSVRNCLSIQPGANSLPRNGVVSIRHQPWKHLALAMKSLRQTECPNTKKRSKSWCCRNAQGYTGL